MREYFTHTQKYAFALNKIEERPIYFCSYTQRNKAINRFHSSWVFNFYTILIFNFLIIPKKWHMKL